MVHHSRHILLQYYFHRNKSCLNIYFLSFLSSSFEERERERERIKIVLKINYKDNEEQETTKSERD